MQHDDDDDDDNDNDGRINRYEEREEHKSKKNIQPSVLSTCPQNLINLEIVYSLVYSSCCVGYYLCTMIF